MRTKYQPETKKTLRKKTLRNCAMLILAALLNTAVAANWYAPQEPFRVYDYIYYVGTGGISAVLIAPVAQTRAVRDGETIRIGPLAVTTHFTPSHTRGGTSWTWQAEENGRSVNVLYPDSLTAVAAEGRRFSGNPLYPEASADVMRSFAIVEALPCDVLISAHLETAGLWERKAKQPALGDAAFIDTAACRNYVAKARAVLAKTLAAEQKSGSAGRD